MKASEVPPALRYGLVTADRFVASSACHIDINVAKPITLDARSAEYINDLTASSPEGAASHNTTWIAV